MNDAAVTVILNYMEECLFEPMFNWPKDEFNQRTYSRWATNEILELVMDHPFTSPTMVIDEFIIKMTCFSCVTKDANASFIFSTASNTAEDVLLLFL